MSHDRQGPRDHRAALGVVFEDWHNHQLVGCQPRRKDQPLVVAVRHDDRAHHARAQTPARGPGEVQLVVLIKELDVESLREVLPRIQRRLALTSLMSYAAFLLVVVWGVVSSNLKLTGY